MILFGDHEGRVRLRLGLHIGNLAVHRGSHLRQIANGDTQQLDRASLTGERIEDSWEMVPAVTPARMLSMSLPMAARLAANCP